LDDGTVSQPGLLIEGAFQPEVEGLALAVEDDDGASGNCCLIDGRNVSVGEPARSAGGTHDAIWVLNAEFAGEEDGVSFGQASKIFAEQFGEGGIDRKGCAMKLIPVSTGMTAAWFWTSPEWIR